MPINVNKKTARARALHLDPQSYCHSFFCFPVTVIHLRTSTMRSSFLLAGNLWVILGTATSAKLERRDEVEECVQDGLLNCFSSSLVQASQFCTNSIVTATAFTVVVTVTPTVTVTNAITETATITEPVTEPTTIAQSLPLKARRRKRGCSNRPPLNCLRSFASSVEPLQFTSACGCIGITSTTELATVTADVTSTIFETPTVTEYVTVSPTPVEEESTQQPTTEPTTTEPAPTTPIEESTLEPTATPTPEVTTTTTAEESTLEPTTTTAPEPTTSTVSVPESTTSAAPPPLITNGDFSGNSLEGWSITNRIGTGASVGVISQGAGNYMMEIQSSYFVSAAITGLSVSQTINCEPGADYRLTFRISVISSYTNGNPWSVVLGGRSITSGPGSSLAWTQIGYTFVCSATQGGNDLTFRIQSNNNRAARMLVDDVVVTKL
ncbi:Putative protein of unknown function [Podospora comata]|uniref:CBM-cenC domain-containing protein n=1 Tax=Podospora comata TaxID=48703 RepID=A0ABY6S5T7_PODCO|nr:Putative protein of unknown function [Podospora comata]